MNKEENKELDFEKISFGIILKSGEAKSLIFESMRHIQSGNETKFRKNIKVAKKLIGEAGALHMDVIISEAKGNDIPFKVIFMHAEDQFMSTQLLIDTIEILYPLLAKK